MSSKCWSNADVTVYTVRRFITTRRLLQKLRSIGSFLRIRLPPNKIIYLAHLLLPILYVLFIILYFSTLSIIRYFSFVPSSQVYPIINSFTRIKIKKIHDYLPVIRAHSIRSYTNLFVLSTFLYSRDLICRFLRTANPITFLDRFGIWIFQKAKPARVSIALSRTLLLSFAFVVLLVRVTFTCTTPIIAISGNGSPPFTPGDPGTPFHCPNFFILSHRILNTFPLCPRKYFLGEEKSRVMPQHAFSRFHRLFLFFFSSLPRRVITRGMTRKSQSADFYTRGGSPRKKFVISNNVCVKGTNSNGQKATPGINRSGRSGPSGFWIPCRNWISSLFRDDQIVGGATL